MVRHELGEGLVSLPVQKIWILSGDSYRLRLYGQLLRLSDPIRESLGTVCSSNRQCKRYHGLCVWSDYRKNSSYLFKPK